MKRYLLFLFCLLCMTSAFAQSMSDQQILQFIARENRAGRSQSQIMTSLVQRGVTVDQIRRLRDQYGSQLQGQNVVNGRTFRTDVNRMRTDNGLEERTVTSGQVQGAGGSVTTQMEGDLPSTIFDDLLKADSLAQKKKVFGRDIFNNKLLTFAPNMNIATPQNYVLGPGDQLVIDIYGASQRTHQLTVSPDGYVTVPNYGPIQVSGLTVAGAKSKIRSSLGSRYASSDIQLTVGQTRTIMVNVMGMVNVPGTYTVSAFATVFHALYCAGGINDIGTLRNVKVFRQGKLVTVVDIYEYILNGRLAGNIHLQDNDVIQVGSYDCLVDIEGKVKNPMYYEMRSRESVGTLIKYAGGFTGDAYKKAVRLVRQTGEMRSVHTIGEFDMSSFNLADGDSVTVDAILDRFENMVEIKGAVFRPAQYELGSEINTVKSLIKAADGVTEDAFTAHAVLTRMQEDRSLITIPVDVAGILNGTVADIPLKNEDILFIPTQTELIAERTLTINGEVLNPGDYQYAANTTIEDLVMQAGGLKDGASTVKVDVSRRIVDSKALKSGDEIAKTYSFSLKDGFVVDGQQGFVLEPYDIVEVRRSPGFHMPKNVMVEGEVNFEGNYTLAKKNQRLSDVIKAAGGVTDQAYVAGARLERLMTDQEKAQRQTIIRLAQQQSDERDSIRLDQLMMSDTYPVGIHLDKALDNPGGDDDLVLREGDRLVVPEYNGTVRVSGRVMYPNTVAYNPGKNYKYYVNLAGGFGDRAKKSKTYIVYQNGTVSQVGRGVKIEPGCEIIVPQKAKRNTMGLAQWLSVGSSLTSIAAMVATLANVLK
jgi:protein involved in polysaccharide export with SLBB domain